MPQFRIDWTFVIIALALSGYSLSLIWSTNPVYVSSQLLFFVIGFILYIFITQFNTQAFEHYVPLLYILSILLLTLTLFSSQVRGASRWIELFGIRMQPSELVKPFIIVCYAYLISAEKLLKITTIVKQICLFILPIIIIFLQPDLGNVIIFTLFLAGMLFAGNLNIKVFFSFAIILVVISPLFWNFLHDYQKQRIVTFLSPQHDPSGAGYNAIQAMIAVGSGKIVGQGLGRGTQSHLRFLPENHTDFIFASLAEEFGLFGCILLLGFYGLIFIKLLKSALDSDTKFQYLIIIGIFIQLLSQVFINIAMNIGIVPITGVTLPFLSSGGSSIIATFIALGIIAALEKDKKRLSLVIR